MNTDTQEFNCADGKIACSTNSQKGGSTLCVTSASDCPITDLVVHNSSSTYPSLANYKTDLSTGSSQFSLYLAFTSGDNDRSNAPLQSITWENGQLCAFTNQANV